MDKETLLRIQQTAEETLMVIDEMAKKAGVFYYLFYGSALGAVRHQGFIPWDDDADIIMFDDNLDLRFVMQMGRTVRNELA